MPEMVEGHWRGAFRSGLEVEGEMARVQTEVQIRTKYFLGPGWTGPIWRTHLGESGHPKNVHEALISVVKFEKVSKGFERC